MNSSVESIATNTVSPISVETASQAIESTSFPPDPNLTEITMEIDGDFSQPEIAEMLFAKWLDHFSSESISPEYRIVEHKIDSIHLPVNQQCADKLGAFFTAEVVSTIKSFISLASRTTYEHSNWAAGGDDFHFL